ncbi:MAG: hypothetical protein C5B44_00550 [Acidobacteria bacterium]|nr:MAG: hypothetical protein C5B44_00550 [Acidobacteriota bacterium]
MFTLLLAAIAARIGSHFEFARSLRFLCSAATIILSDVKPIRSCARTNSSEVPKNLWLDQVAQSANSVNFIIQLF